MSPIIVDAHAHTLYEGANYIHCCATKPEEWSFLINSVSPTVHTLSLGVHPWFSDNLPLNWEETLIDLMEMHPTISLGECGLDYQRCSLSEEIQLPVFEKQWKIAVELQRTMTIHMLKGWESLNRLYQKFGLPGKGVLLHRFGGSKELAKQLVQKGFSFSLHPELMCREKLLRELLEVIPEHALLIESDFEEGKVEPYIYDFYVTIAHYLGRSIEELSSIQLENYARLFL